MGRRALLNIWLAAALAVLVWVVWQEPGRAPEPTASLTALAPAAVDRIARVNRSGTLTLVKRDGIWQVQAPWRIAANPVRVDSLLKVAEAESRSRFPAAGKELAPFGLDEPAVRLQLNDMELKVGGTAPLDQQRYVRVGDTIHLIDDLYTFELNADATAYVSRDLVPKGAQLKVIALPELTVSRSADGKWSVAPARPNTAQDAVRKLADAWGEAQALRVARYDKRPGQGTIELNFSNGQAPLRYEIIARAPELIMARPDLGLQYYLVKEEAVRLLALPPPADKDEQKKE